MHVITGLSYYEKIDQYVKDVVSLSKENPFEQYLFIHESPKVLEKQFFKYTDLLLNIRVLSMNQLLEEIVLTSHLKNKEVITSAKLMYKLYVITHTLSLNCFKDINIALIKELMSLMKDYDLFEVNYNDHLSDKLDDYLDLYRALMNSLESDTYLNKESLLLDNDINFNHYHIYIDLNKYNTKLLKLISKLSESNDVTVFLNYDEDDRLLNRPYKDLYITNEQFTSDLLLPQYLFSHQYKNIKEDAFMFTAASPQDEVNKVLSLIHEKVADDKCRYKDFMIVYSDDLYKQIIIDECAKRAIPNTIEVIEPCIYERSYRYILNQIDKNQYTSIQQMLESFLDNKILDNTYIKFLEPLKDFDYPMNPKDLKDYFVEAFNYGIKSTINSKECLIVCAMDQAYIDEPKHIFYIGLNDSVCPKVFKDNQLLLDEDIELLSSNKPFTTLINRGIHENNILKALLLPSLTKTFSYSSSNLNGDQLLESTLYKQLKKLYNVLSIPKIKDLRIEDLYQSQGRTDLFENTRTVNQMIDTFINQPDVLNEKSVEELYPACKSVSQIEAYNKCPFMYYLKYGLKIEKKKESSLELNEIGTLVHEVLEKCIRSDLNPNDVVNEYLDQHKDIEVKLQDPINSYFMKCLRLDLPVTLHVLKHFNEFSKFDVYKEEYEINDSIAGIPFTGFIDRVDTTDDHVMVIDYKSSNKDLNLNLALQGFNIQMLLYLRTITKELNKEPAAVLYFNTKHQELSKDLPLDQHLTLDDLYNLYKYNGYVLSDSIRDVDTTEKLENIPVKATKSGYTKTSKIITKEQLDILFNGIEEHIKNIYEKMLSGDISISPIGSDNSNIHAHINPCRYCDYKPICEFDLFYNDYKNVELDKDQILGGEDDGL